MKRTISLILCTVMALGLAVVPVSTPVFAASENIGIIGANPGEDCNTQMGIFWHSKPECTECFIEYKEASSEGWDGAQKVVGTYSDTDYQAFLRTGYAKGELGVFKEEDKYLNYRVDLKHLTPATDYKYRIGDGLGGYSDEHYFTTSGADEYSFVWISDFHYVPGSDSRIVAASNAFEYCASQAKYDLDFVFSTGDTGAFGGGYFIWKTIYEQRFASEYMYVDLLGNHDYLPSNKNTGNSIAYFQNVHNNPENCFLGNSTEPYEPGVVYYFLYNDILWFVFNNETMGATVREQIQDWAGKVIESMEGKYRYIFLSEHYQWFNGNTGSASHYSNWSDFCDKYGVDVCFAANNHVYARTHRIYEGKVVPDDSDVGTYYIQAPNSDCDRGNTDTFYDPPRNNADLLAKTYKNTSNPARTHGASVIDVDENGLTLHLYASETGSATVTDFKEKDSVFISAKRDKITREPEPDGDVNFDFVTDNLDAVLVLKAEAGLELPEGCDLYWADMDKSGTTDNIDAVAILKIDAGL